MKCPCGGTLVGWAIMDGYETFLENDGEMVNDETIVEDCYDFWVECDSENCPFMIQTVQGEEHKLFSFDGEQFIPKENNDIIEV